MHPTSSYLDPPSRPPSPHPPSPLENKVNNINTVYSIDQSNNFVLRCWRQKIAVNTKFNTKWVNNT